MQTIPPQRHLFDIPDDIAYFNCAYNSPQLRRTSERLAESVAAKRHPWQRVPADFFADADTLRTLAAQTLGGDAQGYAVVPSASYGLSNAARAVQPRLARNERILVLEEEFPSNFYPWVRIAQEAGAHVDTVPRPLDGGWTDALLARMTGDVRVVAAPPCHWTDGSRIDLVAIGRACRDVGAFLVVDATQTLGAVPLAIDEIKPDFLVAAGYKWLLFPYGVGLMHVGEAWREARPLEESWISRDGAQNFAGLTRYTDRYLVGARRFDVGETCTALLPGAIAALEQIAAWSVPAIAESLRGISARIVDHLRARGFRLADGERSAHMVGARLPAGHRGDLVGALRAKNVFVSQRGESVRFAPHLHVDDRDMQRLFEAIDAALGHSRS